MTHREAGKFLEEKFFPLIEKRFIEKWPDTFVKSLTLDEELYNNSNGTMYTYYLAIKNSLCRLPDVSKYKKSKDDMINSNYSYVNDMYDDFEKTDDIAGWFMEFVPISTVVACFLCEANREQPDRSPITRGGERAEIVKSLGNRPPPPVVRRDSPGMGVSYPRRSVG